MSVRDSIATDVVVSPFGADAAEMVSLAALIEASGFDGVETFDHFSGAMVDRPWSHEVFGLLGAFVAVTGSARVGPMVANMMNRHPVMLASAMGTLQSMSGGRGVLGIGAGAVPGSRFASEHGAIGRELGDGPTRRRRLRETIEVVRLIWAGGGTYDGEFFELNDLTAVVGPDAEAPIIVGAGGEGTVDLACEHADGVNILSRASPDELIVRAGEATEHRSFEVSVHAEADFAHPYGGDVERLIDLGVARRTLAVAPPFDRRGIEALGARLNS